MVQSNFVVGDIDGNTDKIIKAIDTNGETNDLTVFSELSITGYPPLDLLNDSSFISHQNKALAKIINYTKKFPLHGYVIGHVREKENKLYNSLSLIENGKVLYTYDKRKLPTYNIFDEDRYFTPGDGGNLFKYKNKTIAFFICEDIWPENGETVSVPVKSTLKVADVAIAINASPSNVGKVKERFILAEHLVKCLKCPLIYVNQTGGYDELIFDGDSFCMNSNGIKVSQTKLFAVDLVSVSLDLADRKMSNGEYLIQTDNITKSIDDDELLYQHATIGIRDYVKKCGFKGVVIGSSGGIDSAMVIALATDALGSENVIAITMPTQFSSEGSVSDSKSLCDKLNVKLIEHPIGNAFDTINGEFTETFECADRAFGVTQENMQARIRGLILMGYSNMFGHLVLSTGNKSEMSVGYATLYGDMNGGINPLGDMYKTEVFSLAEYYNRLHDDEIIPKTIITKAPSAELAPDQLDTNSLVPYHILDKILKVYIEGDVIGELYCNFIKKLIRMHKDQGELNDDDIIKMVRLVINSEYKRKQAPPIIRCQCKAFGFGRNMPVATRNCISDKSILEKFEER